MKPRSDLTTHCSRVRNWSSDYSFFFPFVCCFFMFLFILGFLLEIYLGKRIWRIVHLEFVALLVWLWFSFGVLLSLDLPAASGFRPMNGDPTIFQLARAMPIAAPEFKTGSHPIAEVHLLCIHPSPQIRHVKGHPQVDQLTLQLELAGLCLRFGRGLWWCDRSLGYDRSLGWCERGCNAKYNARSRVKI